MTWLRQKAAAAQARLRERNGLVLEILALRHQLAVLRRTGTRRPRFRLFDRLLWVFLSRRWSGGRGNLIVVQAETVPRWRRQWLLKTPNAPKSLEFLDSATQYRRHAYARAIDGLSACMPIP